MTSELGVKDVSIKLLDNGGKKPDPVPFDLTDAFTSIQKPNWRRPRRKKPPPLLKYRFCKLSYNTENERREHELAWHSEKMKKDASGRADEKSS